MCYLELIQDRHPILVFQALKVRTWFKLVGSLSCRLLENQNLDLQAKTHTHTHTHVLIRPHICVPLKMTIGSLASLALFLYKSSTAPNSSFGLYHGYAINSSFHVVGVGMRRDLGVQC